MEHLQIQNIITYPPATIIICMTEKVGKPSQRRTANTGLFRISHPSSVSTHSSNHGYSTPHCIVNMSIDITNVITANILHFHS